MTPADANAPASRYRRPTGQTAFNGVPMDNLLWRSPKVPARREEAAVQLDFLGTLEPAVEPDAPERPLPNPRRLAKERIELTVRDTLQAMRPQLNRMVREIETHLDTRLHAGSDAQLVDQALEQVAAVIATYVNQALALSAWNEQTDRG